MPCTCSISEPCNRRAARGLLRFCDPALAAQTPRIPKPKTWPTYGAAAEANPGKRIRSVGGYLNGSPRAFVAE